MCFPVIRRYDPEWGEDSFDNPKVRAKFVRKVYFILSIQLVVTVGLIMPFLFVDEVADFVLETPYLIWIALSIVLVTMLAIVCCNAVRHLFPLNYIMLGIFTLAEAFLMSIIAVYHDQDIVLIALGATAAICVGLSIFALQVKFDFTGAAPYIFVAGLILLIFGIIAIFVWDRIFRLIYCSVGVLIFSMYLVFDTQMMLGGRHKYSLSPDEHVYAALSLYVDIVNIFMYLVGLIDAASN